MLLLDVTVVNVVLPVIRDKLDASFAELQWVIDAYALTLAATLPTVGERSSPPACSGSRCSRPPVARRAPGSR